MRYVAPLAACMLQLACHAGEPVPQPVCAVEAPTFNSKEVTCTIPVQVTARAYEFVVNFSGGHDDTLASMAPMLDANPLVCGSGSKLELSGEDGDVSLRCRFAVAGAPGGASRLRVLVHWSHAEYTNHELAAR